MKKIITPDEQTKNLEPAIKTMIAFCDDFIFDIVIVRHFDESNDYINGRNRTCLFLYGHTIELAIKTAFLYKFGETPDASHNTTRMLKKLCDHSPSIASKSPKPKHFEQYKEVYLASGGKVQNTKYPKREDLDFLEIAFAMDCGKNLKYGLDRNMDLVTSITINKLDRKVNIKFLKFLHSLRDIYANEEADSHLRQKLLQINGENKIQYIIDELNL
jgi:hypothetical protein